MSGASRPLVVVFGATGSQGGSVLRSLLATDNYTIRAITRNPQSVASLELAKLSGVEVVKADAANPSSLPTAFSGAWGAFLVTSFWDTAYSMNPDTDWVQGKALVDAAVDAKVQFLVWSSLHDVQAITGGRIDAPHFTKKNLVEQYVRSLSVQASFVYAGIYTENWNKFSFLNTPHRLPSGRVELRTCLRADVSVPMIDIEKDFGNFVAPMFAAPSRFHGHYVLAATDYKTYRQLADTYTKVTGEEVELIPIPVQEVREKVNDEAANMIQLWNEYGMFNGEHLNVNHNAVYKRGEYPEQSNAMEGWLIRTRFIAQPY